MVLSQLTVQKGEYLVLSRLTVQKGRSLILSGLTVLVYAEMLGNKQTMVTI